VLSLCLFLPDRWEERKDVVKKTLLIAVGVVFCFIFPIFLLLDSLSFEGEVREDGLAAAQVASSGAGRAALHDQDLSDSDVLDYAAAAAAADWAAEDSDVDRAEALEAAGSLAVDVGKSRLLHSEAYKVAVETGDSHLDARVERWEKRASVLQAWLDTLFGEGTPALGALGKLAIAAIITGVFLWLLSTPLFGRKGGGAS